MGILDLFHQKGISMKDPLGGHSPHPKITIFGQEISM